jgi:hypothetical protein
MGASIKLIKVGRTPWSARVPLDPFFIWKIKRYGQAGQARPLRGSGNRQSPEAGQGGQPALKRVR